MTICKQYFADKDLIEIIRADNGRFFIEYGVTYENGKRSYTCSAGHFPTFESAHATLMKHRPHAISA